MGTGRFGKWKAKEMEIVVIVCEKIAAPNSGVSFCIW